MVGVIRIPSFCRSGKWAQFHQSPPTTIHPGARAARELCCLHAGLQGVCHLHILEPVFGHVSA